MVTIYTGKRGSGKTTKLINEANKLYEEHKKVLFVVTNKVVSDFLRNKGLNKNIEVLTYDEYTNNKSVYRDYDLFIDELEFFLMDLLQNYHIKATSDLECHEKLERISCIDNNIITPDKC